MRKNGVFHSTNNNTYVIYILLRTKILSFLKPKNNNLTGLEKAKALKLITEEEFLELKIKRAGEQLQKLKKKKK